MLRNLASILFSILLTSCTSPPQEILRPVESIKITADCLDNGEQTFSGVVNSMISTKLSFQIDGNITSLLVNEGDFLKKGQVIATLDTEPYEIIYEENIAQKGQSVTNYRNDIKYYARLAKLYQEGAISERQLDDARAQAEISANALKLANRRIDYEQLKLNYATLKAPMDGYIGKIDVENHENIKAGSPILTFISDKENEVKINVPENYINLIKKNQKVTIKIDSIEKPFDGYVSDIGANSIENYGTFPVTIKIKNPISLIKSGMSAYVTMKLKKCPKDAIIIPFNAILDENGKKYVYIIKPENPQESKTIKTQIEISEPAENGIKVTKGLKMDDIVVIAGINKIKDGMSVKTPKNAIKSTENN